MSLRMKKSIQIPGTINFGKHKGKDVSWLVEYERNYCNWVLDQVNASSELKELQKEINNLIRNDPNSSNGDCRNIFDQYAFVEDEKKDEEDVQDVKDEEDVQDVKDEEDEEDVKDEEDEEDEEDVKDEEDEKKEEEPRECRRTRNEKRPKNEKENENFEMEKKQKQEDIRIFSSVSSLPFVPKNNDSICLLLDIETTICREKRLLEIGYIKFQKDTYEILDTYESLVKFKSDIPFQQYYKNDITESMCNMRGKDLKLILDELLENLKDVCEIYAYNIMFDINKILQLCTTTNHIQLLSTLQSKKFYDIMDYGKKYQKQIHQSKKYSAERVYNNLFGTEIIEEHRSLSDCKMELEILKHIPQLYKQNFSHFTVQLVDNKIYKLKR